jgi:hypothetical protein
VKRVWLLNNVFLRETNVMRKHAVKLALLALVASTLFAPSADAKIGSVRVVFTKAAFVGGAGVGRGVLTFEGRSHRFRVYGLSVGVSIGASIARFVGHAAYLNQLSDFEGSYSSVGTGGAVIAGGGNVQLKNDKGVIITLHGVRTGLELASNLGGVRIAFD